MVGGGVVGWVVLGWGVGGVWFWCMRFEFCYGVWCYGRGWLCNIVRTVLGQRGRVKRGETSELFERFS